MGSELKARIIASISTAIIAVLVVLLLSFSYLNINILAEEPPKGEITLLEEDYVDFLEPSISSSQGNEEAASFMEEEVINESQPTPASGTDVEDVGKIEDPAPLVTQKDPSPVKVTEKKPKDEGAKVDKQKLEQEKVKREASNEVANAFKNASGKNNSLTSSNNDNGPSGNRTLNSASQGITGTGSGSVGGGWIIPKYAPVRSTVTGSVKMEVRIDNTGHVQKVTFTGGQPPAATDKSVQMAIEREIRSRKFSRATYDDAEDATAYITYTFK